MSKCYLSSECEVVMRKHDTFGHAGSSGGVDEVATLVDGDPFETFFQFILILFLTNLKQVLPAQDTLLGWGTQVLNDSLKLCGKKYCEQCILDTLFKILKVLCNFSTYM